MRFIVDKLKTDHKIVVSMIIYKDKLMYDDSNSNHNERLENTIEHLYEQIEKTEVYPGKKYIPLVISAADTDGVDVVCPIVRYILK